MRRVRGRPLQRKSWRCPRSPNVTSLKEECPRHWPPMGAASRLHGEVTLPRGARPLRSGDATASRPARALPRSSPPRRLPAGSCSSQNAALGPLLPGSPQGQHPPGSVCLPARIVGAVSPRRPAVCSSARGRPHIPVTLGATCPSVFGSPVPAHRMPSLAGILYALKWDCLNTRFKIMTFHSLNFVWYFLMKNKSSSNNFKTNEFQILFYSIPHLKSWHLLRCSLDGSFS